MKRKWVILSLIIACVFMLTSCGLSSKTDSTETEAVTPTEKLYNQAVAYGYEGTLADFLASLKGDSAYDIAVKNGFEGTETEWLDSLKGEKGDPGQDGQDGEQVVAETIKGDSAYDIAVKNGFEGTEEEWLLSLKGTDGIDGVDGENGKDGKDATLTIYGIYEELTEKGYEGTFEEFLTSYLTLSGEKGVSQSNLLSSISIVCSFPVQQYVYTFRGYYIQTVTATSAGSGVIYSLNKEAGEAYIITNYHVVYNSSSTVGISNNICVCLYGSEIVGSEFYSEEFFGENALSQQGMGINATYVGGSMYYDIAVLKIKSDRLKTADVAAVTFADSNEISVSEVAYAVGNAEGEGISVTKGVVSVDSENITMVASDGKSYATFRVMRIDTAVNSGNSGGGLFDSEGKLIGIVNAKTTEDGVENISYALPSNVVKYIVENILYYKDTEEKTSDVRKCMLGISVSTPQSSAVLGKDGKVRIVEKVIVASVAENSLADGILEQGDVLIGVKVISSAGENVYTIDRSFVIIDLMLTLRVGDTLIVEYDRNGTISEATFVMTEECISEIR